MIWFILWMVIAFDSPPKHPRISNVEKEYIEDSIGSTKKNETVSIMQKLKPICRLRCRKLFCNRLSFYQSFALTYYNVKSCFTYTFLIVICRTMAGYIQISTSLGNYRGSYVQQLGHIHFPNKHSYLYERSTQV